MKGDRIHDPYDQQQHDDGYDVHVQHVHDDARQKVSAHRQHTRLIFLSFKPGSRVGSPVFSFPLASRYFARQARRILKYRKETA